MSSGIIKMWPAMALLLAAVWHWGVPAEPAQAQASPVFELRADTLTGDNVAMEIDTLTVSASGYDPDERDLVVGPDRNRQ